MRRPTRRVARASPSPLAPSEKLTMLMPAAPSCEPTRPIMPGRSSLRISSTCACGSNSISTPSRRTTRGPRCSVASISRARPVRLRRGACSRRSKPSPSPPMVSATARPRAAASCSALTGVTRPEAVAEQRGDQQARQRARVERIGASGIGDVQPRRRRHQARARLAQRGHQRHPRPDFARGFRGERRQVDAAGDRAGGDEIDDLPREDRADRLLRFAGRCAEVRRQDQLGIARAAASRPAAVRWRRCRARRRRDGLRRAGAATRPHRPGRRARR